MHSPSLVSILGSAFEDGDPAKQKSRLLEKIYSAVQNCPRTLVVIEDADQLAEGVLGTIFSFATVHQKPSRCSSPNDGIP